MDSAGASPAMRQYFQAKEQYPDALLFFRMGDFYELFYEDAVRAAQVLDLTLTSRSKGGDGEPIPMAGVPWHSAGAYLARLLERGFKVAICEQMADPRTVRGIVPREVVRVVTPGLALDADALDARADNVLVALAAEGDEHGIAVLDPSRADLSACVVTGGAALIAELVRLDPREVLVLAADVDADVRRALPRARVATVEVPADPQGAIREIAGAEAARGAERLRPPAALACAAALLYARAAQPRAPLGVRAISPYDPRARLVLDDVAVRNLELVRTLSGERAGSLLALLDETCTPMGARALRRRLLAPLADVAAIRRRHDAVEAFVLDPTRRQAVRRALAEVGDLERLATRAELGLATPRDLAAIRDGTRAAERAIEALAASAAGALADVLAALLPGDPCSDVASLLERALVAQPPAIASAGGIVRDGVDPRLDELRRLAVSSKDVLLDIERRERQSTGIASLKVGFTKVFGYYIEVTRPNLHLVPAHFRRKQTVANGERYTTDELEELQGKILSADERSKAIEAEIFEDLRRQVGAAAPRLRALARALAEIDVHAALAEVAHRRGYVRPEVDDSLAVDLVDCRHPIVEALAPAGTFVPNDVCVDADGARMLVITGPNMAGKSTTMREVALAAIMAQMGSFVAATRARLGLVDRVFTRVGASDDLGRGQSTFMVEMQETATILREATRRSLVILDEIGRGTSTYDGLAIAWAVAEHLHDVVGCRTLFATHYHELCELERTHRGVRNVNVSAKEHRGEVVFLHRLVPGASNRSYGVSVARLAGLPASVVDRARQLLDDLERGGPLPGGAGASLRARVRAESPQMDLFGAAVPGGEAASEPDPACTPGRQPPGEHPVVAALRELEPERLSPIDALLALARLKKMLSDR